MSKARDIANAGTALTAVSATELGYLDGVTSAVQTQINSKIGQATAINPTIVDAKGDLIAATGADTVSRVAVGSNGQLLAANSATATGLEWQTVSSGGMTLISETTASGLTGLSLSSIPQTYKQIMLEWEGIFHTDYGQFFLRFNNNSGNVYWGSLLTFQMSNQNISSLGGNATSVYPAFGNGVNRNPTTEMYFNCRGSLLIDNYASTTMKKKYKLGFQYYDNQNSEYRGQLVNNLFFDSTSAITSLDIVRTAGSGTFSNLANTSIRLYGIS